MSHIVTIETEVRDAAAVAGACHRLNLPLPIQGTSKLFVEEAEGLAVQLPGWKYPLVCDTARGRLKFDNYEGRWGDRSQLDRFLQAYAVEKAKLEARKRGNTVTEQSQTDGSIRLTIQIGGSR